jgi:putative ABC transport system permease protein
MDALINDVQFAIRSLAKSKLFTIVALASLALGIGANVTVFTLVNSIAIKPLPYADQDRLVDIHEWSATKLCSGCGVGTSYPTFIDWRDNARSFVGMGAYMERPFAVSGTETPERIGGAVVSANVFDLLGVHPQLGRSFRPDDDRVGAAPVVLLSEGLWTRRYGADRRIVGQSIRVNGVAHTVIGIMPPRFKFPEFADLWVPLVPIASESPRDDRSYGVVGRLRPDVSMSKADAEMMTIAKSLEERHPDTQKEWTAHATSLRADFAGIEKSLYSVMLGAVGFVLLIVCANLAGLLLARGAQRQKEIAIRLALGGTRAQLVRHLLTESMMLSLAGGALGVLVASWGVGIMSQSFRGQLPGWIDLSMDWRVVAFTVSVSLITGFLFGFLPALRASNPEVYLALKEGILTVHRSRVRGLLVIVELALALILLAGAGDLMKSVLRISARADGIDERNLLTGRVQFLDAKYHNTSTLRFSASEIATRMERLPGATSATLYATGFIAGFGGHDEAIRAEGVASVPPNSSPRFYFSVTPAYFTTVKLPIVAGRGFTAADRAGAERVVVINARSAEAIWPGASPIGKRIKLGSADSLPWFTVVGVVGNTSERGRARDFVYVPFDQVPGDDATLLVRARSEPMALAPGLRAAVSEVDSDLPVVDVQTVDQQHSRNYSPYKLYAMSMAAFASFAILLAAVGLYGVIAYTTAQRTREIGVRMALGAEVKHVVSMIATQGARLVFVGIALGLAGSFAVLRVIESMLFGASPIDLPIFGAVSLLLAVASLLAIWVPARRAARVDPLEALRAE